MRPKRKLAPYLVAGLILAYLGHILTKGYQSAPAGGVNQPFFQFEWLLLNLERLNWLDLSLNSFSLLMAFLGFLIPLFAYLRVEDRGLYRHGEEAGSARFATVQELSRFQDKDPEKNMIFTQNGRMGLYNKRLAYENQLNKNVAVIGLPGDGKTFTFVKPNLMQMEGSFVVTDPKGLLVHEVGKMLEDHGYQIKVFDLVHLSNSNQFNVFTYMRSELDIDRVAEAITDGTKKSDNQGEDFWVQAELMLMRALLGYLYFDSRARHYEPNLSMVADMLRHLQPEDPNSLSKVEVMFEELNHLVPNNYAYKQWQLFNANFKNETRTSVLAVMSARYSVFDHAAVTSLISRDTMDMETWNTQKTAVFIAIPETNKAFNFLASVMFAMMFDILTHQADAILQGQSDKFQAKDLLHVQFIIDEFANIGKIPNFNEVLASIRSREMSIKIILQAINQLKSMYRYDWQSILNNCASLLYLGTNDEDTMKYFSMRAGKQTIAIKNRSISRGRNGSMSESHQTQSRDLMTPDEIARIGVDEALLFIAKQQVLKDKKASVLTHPKAAFLANSPEDKESWYTYKRYASDEDEFLDNVKETKTIVVDITQNIEEAS